MVQTVLLLFQTFLVLHHQIAAWVPLYVIRPPDGLHHLKKNRNTIFGRTLDTLEDAFRVASRLPVEKGWVERPPLEESCPDLVVLGSGWAAHALLKIVDTTKTRLTVISPSNHFVFTPSKYSTPDYTVSKALHFSSQISIKSACIGICWYSRIQKHDRIRSCC